MPEKNTCPVCSDKELSKLKSELHECKQRGKAKDSKIKALDKKVFILMCIVVGIGAIWGKEALDAIGEWLDSAGRIKGGVDNLTGSIVPAPGTLAVFALVPFLGGSRKRKQ